MTPPGEALQIRMGSAEEPRLIVGAGAGDEDVHEPLRAQLPVRAGGDVRDSDQSSEEIEGLDILPHVAASDRTPDQQLDRRADETVGGLVKPFGPADERVQGRRNNLLGRNVIDKQEHPCTQRIDGGHGLRESARRGGQSLHLSLVNGLNEGIARGEVAIEGARADRSLFRNIVETGFSAEMGKGGLRYFQDPFAVAQSIDAGLARGGLRGFSGHRQKTCNRR